MPQEQPPSPGTVLGLGVLLMLLGGLAVLAGSLHDGPIGALIGLGALVAAIGNVVTLVGAAGVGTGLALRRREWEADARERRRPAAPPATGFPEPPRRPDDPDYGLIDRLGGS